MPSCAAYGCTNRLKKGSGISFFSFPTDRNDGDVNRRKAWIHYCRRVGFEPSKHSKLCSVHFTKKQLDRDPDKLAELGYPNAHAKLKKDAVPDVELLDRTEHQPSGNNNNNTGGNIRGAFAKRRRSEIVQELMQSAESASSNDTTSEVSDCQVAPSEVSIDPTDQYPKFRSVKSQAKLKPQQRTRRIQVNTYEPSAKPNVSTRSVAIQCDLIPGVTKLKKCDDEMNESEDEYESDNESDSDFSDSEYDPSEDEVEDDDSFEYEEESTMCSYRLQSEVAPEKEKQFLVSESALTELLSVCRNCCCKAIPVIQCSRGSSITTKSLCENGHEYEWHSQQSHCRMPWSNLLIAGAVVFSGCNLAKSLRLFNHMNLQMMSQSTLTRLQSYYVIPAITTTWDYHQRVLIESIKDAERRLTLGGDGRCDSPGYSAKYGCYSLMDLETNKILDFQLVQCNEVKGSTHMELEGLKRCLKYLDECDLQVENLITDRHVMIKKFMKTSRPEISHLFDIWHVAKGISKKLESAAKKKECEDIRPWVKSIVNHCYWVAASCGMDGEEKLRKWRTITRHVINKHDQAEGYVPCNHKKITEEKMWLNEGSRAHKLLSEVVEKRHLLADIPKLSPLHQTYGIEVYHSVVNSFAPKNTHFFYAAMTARHCLAVLHFNENGKRMQSRDRNGQHRWKTSYPKDKKGQVAVVKPVRVPATFDYVDELRQMLVERRRQFTTYKAAHEEARQFAGHLPPSLTSGYSRPRKCDLVQQRTSRFNTTCSTSQN